MSTIKSKGKWMGGKINKAEWAKWDRKHRNKTIEQLSGAKSQAKQIVKVNKRVDRILDAKTAPRIGLQHHHYNNTLTDDIIPVIPAAADSGITGMGNWGAWGPNASSASDALIQSVPRMRVGRIYNQLRFTCNTEFSPVQYTVYHVRLNPKTSQNTIIQCGQNLANGNMTEANGYFVRGDQGTHSTASTYGNVVLNPDKFLVKKQWQFTLAPSVAYQEFGTGTTTTGTNPFSTMKQIDFSFPCNYTFGATDRRWVELGANLLDINLRNYILIFTDNASTVEGSPSVRTMHTCIVKGQDGPRGSG